MGYIAVDLDGTLAEYTVWKAADHIGEPVPAMVAHVKAWLAAGREVRIYTARVSPLFGRIGQLTPASLEVWQEARRAEDAIHAWCEEHLGRRLEVTAIKDYAMADLYDDRAWRVEKNTGYIYPGGKTGESEEAHVVEGLHRVAATWPKGLYLLTSPDNARNVYVMRADINGGPEYNDWSGQTIDPKSVVAAIPIFSSIGRLHNKK